MDLDDETVKLVAAESFDMMEERENAERKLATLELSLKTLQRLRSQRVTGAYDCHCKLNSIDEEQITLHHGKAWPMD